MLNFSGTAIATQQIVRDQLPNANKDSFLNQQDTFVECMNEHEKMLKHMILGFEAKPALQEELFQEISLNIWQALPRFKKEASLKTFVARIAHNILATHVAKAVRTIKADDDITEQHDLASSDSTPYQELNKTQRQERLVNGIRKLKLEQQQVITLALEGMSYQEMAEILKINRNLVGVRLQRAKANLMQLMEAI